MSRQTSGSVVCPGCGRLVAVGERSCPLCGQAAPGFFGYSRALGKLGDLSFLQVVIAGCALLYVVSLLVDTANIGMRFPLGILSPSGQAVFLLGASGAVPVLGAGHWWTILSASWLHGGLIHIGFNLYYLRQILPAHERLYGVGRTIILYVLSGACGFAITSLAGAVLPNLGAPKILWGATSLTLGASASLCGLLGGLFYYARRSGQTAMSSSILQSGAMLLAFGLLVPGIDNWAHAGGFLGGWLIAKMLRPLEPETKNHLFLALVCLVLTVLSILVSAGVGWFALRAAG